MTEKPNYNDGKWHGWNGGECPVHPLTRVRAVLYNDTDKIHQFDDYTSGDILAGDIVKYCWTHEGSFRRIIAFRVVEEYRDPREFWINIYPDGVSVAHDSRAAADVTGLPARTECVHVREVL